MTSPSENVSVKLFQLIKEGQSWCIYAVSANDPKVRKLISVADDENVAAERFAEFERIEATHNCDPDDTDRVDLSTGPGFFDGVRRKITLPPD